MTAADRHRPGAHPSGEPARPIGGGTALAWTTAARGRMIGRMVLRGQVRTGKGDFSYWMAKLEAHYTAKTGMRLYPGTLNVHLADGQSFPTPAEGILRLEREEYGGEVSVSIVPCRLFGRRAFILRPDTDDGKDGDPPGRILEVATDVRLRDGYGLRDGDWVDVEV